MQQSHRPLTHARTRTKKRWKNKEFTFSFLVGGHYAYGPLTRSLLLRNAFRDDWHHARRIREYILALIDYQKEQGKELAPDTALGRWATWALQQADRIDPLVASPPSILDRKREPDGWSPYGWR